MRNADWRMENGGWKQQSSVILPLRATIGRGFYGRIIAMRCVFELVDNE
jgi:hypothetical protein